MSAIDFDDYCKVLGDDLLASYLADPSRIKLRYQLAPIRLKAEQAIPCGLIVNELLTNAFKYAYPGDTPGEISISLQHSSEDQLLLRVADQGIGLPNDFTWEQSESFGFKIVQLLTSQIAGTLSFQGPPGTVVELVFPISN